MPGGLGSGGMGEAADEDGELQQLERRLKAAELPPDAEEVRLLQLA